MVPATTTIQHLRGNSLHISSNNKQLNITHTKASSGVYVETDRRDNGGFQGLGVGLIDNVYIGFVKVNPDGSINEPDNFQGKYNQASQLATKIVSVGGATYTDDFRVCLNNQISRENLKTNLVNFAKKVNSPVKINLDFEFPESDLETTYYMELAEGLIQELNQDVSIALPYMTKMRFMLHNEKFKQLLNNDRFKPMIFIYDMTRNAGCSSNDNCWSAYEKGSCLRNVTSDENQIQYINIGYANGNDRGIYTRLSGDGYIALLKNYFGFTEEHLKKSIVGFPTYTALHHLPQSKIISIGKDDSDCAVSEVEVEGNSVDYVPIVNGEKNDVQRFVSWAKEYGVKNYFFYEAGFTTSNNYAWALKNEVDSLNNVTFPEAEVFTFNCLVENCVGGQIKNSNTRFYAIVSDEGKKSDVSFNQEDLNYYINQYISAFDARDKSYDKKNVCFKVTSSYNKNVVDFVIKSDEIYSNQVNTIETLLGKIAPGGLVTESSCPQIKYDESNRVNSCEKSNIIIFLGVALGLSMFIHAYFFWQSCVKNEFNETSFSTRQNLRNSQYIENNTLAFHSEDPISEENQSEIELPVIYNVNRATASVPQSSFESSIHGINANMSTSQEFEFDEIYNSPEKTGVGYSSPLRVITKSV